MGTFRMISTAELKTRKRLSHEDLAIFDQFKSYLTRIENSYAGIYEFSEGEDRKKCKRLLRKAAKALEISIRISDNADSIVFHRRRTRSSKKK
jgi:hypothetical protein